jgi:hypothetical protein
VEGANPGAHRDVKERYRTDDEVMGEEALSTLMRELPEEPRVVEAERHHE